MRLTWADLLIEGISDDDFRRWMSNWEGLVTGRVAPAFMNKFGVWFLRRPEGPVDMLDVLSGTVDRVSENYEDFIAEVNEPWWQETYLLSDLVFRLHQTGKIPGPGQCYALAPHPAIGGPNLWANDPVDLRFVMIMEIGTWQSLCAQLLTQGGNERSDARPQNLSGGDRSP